MCVWNVSEDERRCDICSYHGGCEVRERKRVIEEVGQRYLDVMNGIVGFDIKKRRRLREMVWARNMLFYQLVLDGFSLTRVGKFMGYDHATVYHGKEQVRNMLRFPVMFPDEMAVWQKFQELI